MGDANAWDFAILVLSAWSFVAVGFALLSGWVFLARQFRATSRPRGDRVKGQVRRMGAVNGRLAHMVVSDEGLYLHACLPFRPLYPTLLIPWSQVRLRPKVRIVRWYLYEVELGGLMDIRVTEQAYEQLRSHQRMRKRGRSGITRHRTGSAAT